MSSVRISPHHRSGAAPIGSAGESRGDTSPGGASFAATLGAAAPLPKAPSAPPSTAAASTPDAKGSRRKSGSDDKAADPSTAPTVQDLALAAVAGQVAPPPHDVADHGAAPPSDLSSSKNGGTAGITQATAEPASSSAGLLAGSAPTILPRPAPVLVAAAWSEGQNAPMPAVTADGLADPAVQSPELAANIDSRPQSQPPNATPSNALPAELAGLALPGIASGQPGANTGDPTGSGDDRRRFASVLAASDGVRATEAAAVGGTAETPALANAPAATASPAGVAEASASTTISDQVASHVVRLVTGGSRDMVMRLHPPELGEVTVRVAVSGRDVSAWFGSPQPQVQVAIADGIGQLQAGLGDAGYNLNGAWVGADASGARQQAGGLSLPPATETARTPDFGMTAAPRPSASGLNIYV
jgi:hypothetical protein